MGSFDEKPKLVTEQDDGGLDPLQSLGEQLDDLYKDVDATQRLSVVGAAAS